MAEEKDGMNTKKNRMKGDMDGAKEAGDVGKTGDGAKKEMPHHGHHAKHLMKHHGGKSHSK